MNARNEKSIKKMKELEYLKSQDMVRAFQDSSSQVNIQKNIKRHEPKHNNFFNCGVKKNGEWSENENNENFRAGEETSILMKNDLGKQIGDPKEWLFPQKPAEKENSAQIAKLNKSFNAMNIYL